MIPALQIDGLRRSFGGIHAVQDVTFAVQPREIFGIIGPNGAGKTTLFNLITRTIPASSGSVYFFGKDIGRVGVDVVARAGLIRTFQATAVFKEETVRENLCRAHVFCKLGTPLKMLQVASLHRARKAAHERANEVLEFMDLARVSEAKAGDLAYGLQKTLGVGMALATEPRMLLMDEPAAGLNPTETQRIGDIILKLRSERGITIALVEHDMKMVMSICDRLLVLDRGRMLATGLPSEIQSNQSVIDAYLGVDDELA
jgi:branched-chain amino acid transport system ATP-binding protein